MRGSFVAREAEILVQINEGLLSVKQERLNELIERRQRNTITEKELRELKVSQIRLNNLMPSD